MKHAIWCATYFDKSRVLVIDVLSVVTLQSQLSPLPNEEFTFDYSEKREVELEFGLKKSNGRVK